MSPGRHPYLDSLMELDDNSGRAVQAIRDLGIAENTLVIWTTDNGAWVDAWPDAGYTPFRGMKGRAYEGGFRVPEMIRGPGKIPAGVVSNEVIQRHDWGFFEQLGSPRVDTAARNLGLALVGFGSLAMVDAVWNDWSLNQYLASSRVALTVPQRVKLRWYDSYVVATAALVIGVITVLFMLKVI